MPEAVINPPTFRANLFFGHVAAGLKDRGAGYSQQASLAKLFCTDVAMRVTTDAFQIAGDDLTGRFFRESKVLQIVEGTNQIQRVIIGRMLGSEAGL